MRSFVTAAIQNSAQVKGGRKLLTEMDPRWAAVVARDIRFDGKFVYAVKTIGAYCRASCPSRPAKPENVDYYDTCHEASRAEFRACKRCRPV
jgi:AraC family transcriptional regulator of adaptative response/methylated-DNA-[protein]-cysteine methyltransferase